MLIWIWREEGIVSGRQRVSIIEYDADDMISILMHFWFWGDNLEMFAEVLNAKHC